MAPDAARSELRPLNEGITQRKATEISARISAAINEKGCSLSSCTVHGGGLTPRLKAS
jgi:hypothetical protein